MRNVSVIITRDSVCAADDCHAPHQRRRVVQPSTDPAAFAEETSRRYLPSVAGCGHSWTCLLNETAIALIKGNEIKGLVREIALADQNRVHFVYRSAPL